MPAVTLVKYVNKLPTVILPKLIDAALLTSSESDANKLSTLANKSYTVYNDKSWSFPNSPKHKVPLIYNLGSFSFTSEMN